MSEYFRSAFDYLSGGPAVNSNIATSNIFSTSFGHELVGQHLEINGVKLRVNRLIAEG